MIYNYAVNPISMGITYHEEIFLLQLLAQKKPPTTGGFTNKKDD